MKLELNKIVGLILMVVLMSQNAHAQPPNDFCSGALATSADGTCYGPGLPETTTVGAGDDWVGTLGCAGNNGEVWFSFVATTSQLDINITSGTLGGNIEFVLVQSLTPPCGGLSLGGGGGTACGGSPLTSTFNGLQIGSTYYYTISSTGADGTFTSCLTSSVPTPVAGQDCIAGAILCDASGFTQGTSSAGFGNQEVTTATSCWGSGGERQSKWFKFTIGCSGTLEFMITPSTNSNDYDWGLWDITSDVTCASKGSTIACDWSGCPGATGLSSCPASETGANNTNGNGPGGCGGTYQAVNAPINVTAGNTYALLVDNFTTSNSGFSLAFGGACGGGTAVIGPDANFTGSLDVSCLVFTAIKTCPTANSTYLWNYGDGTTSTAENGSHTYSTNGTYTVSYSVTDALGCVTTSSQTIDVGCLLPVELSEFNATSIKDESISIDWTTITEDDNDFFTIERSKDGVGFEEVNTVEGAGTTIEIQEYNSIDRNPFSGTSYYRLKQTDFDGKFSYSDVKAVFIRSSFSDVSIFPNPVEGKSKVTFDVGTKEEINVSVTDLSGKILLSKNYNSVEGSNVIDLETESLKSGLYLLTLNNGIEFSTIRFVVK
ncbi:MAG: PKD repeat protein [Crocinitomicaceae bacterium]|jgi:PKD repeat protein